MRIVNPDSWLVGCGDTAPRLQPRPRRVIDALPWLSFARREVDPSCSHWTGCPTRTTPCSSPLTT